MSRDDEGDFVMLHDIPGGRWGRIRDIVTTAERERRPLTLVEFGDVLRDLRVLAGLSLGDLSRMLDTTAVKLCYVERGLVTKPDRDGKVERVLTEREKRLARNECGDCGTKVTGAVQNGRCVYLEPCGHRHGQGDARAVRKAFGLSKAVRP